MKLLGTINRHGFPQKLPTENTDDNPICWFALTPEDQDLTNESSRIPRVGAA